MEFNEYLFEEMEQLEQIAYRLEEQDENLEGLDGRKEYLEAIDRVWQAKGLINQALIKSGI